MATLPEMTWQSPPVDAGGAAAASELRFEIRNVGGRPVHITSVTQTCACAGRSLSADFVNPNEKIFLTVKPRQQRFGKNRVRIDLLTDSPMTPVISLAFTAIGSQKPPFLRDVRGDLTFRDFHVGDEREFVVSTVEGSPEERSEPRCESSLPFLRFERKAAVVKPMGEPIEMYLRTSTYRVRIASPPPADSFFGEVRIPDPWNRPFDQRLFVKGETSPPIRSSPARLIVDSADDFPKTFLVFARSGGEKMSVRATPKGEGSPFLVEPAEAEVGERPARFTLRRRPGETVRPGLHEIEIASTTGPYRVTLPILVREGRP